MKQLSFDFGGHKTPTFREWYHENSTERRKWNEVPYTESEAKIVYRDLIAKGFFKRGDYNA